MVERNGVIDRVEGFRIQGFDIFENGQEGFDNVDIGIVGKGVVLGILSVRQINVVDFAVTVVGL